MRNRRDIGVAQQRKNRMVHGRARNFDLPPPRKLAVHREHTPQRLPLLARHHGLILKSVVAALSRQLRHFLVALNQSSSNQTI